MKVLGLLFLAALVVICSCQPQQFATQAQNENDYRTLNYALTLEHLEAAFYTEGLLMFNETDFDNAGLPSGTRSYFNLIRAHEASHVNLLTSVLEASGAEAVGACTYNFASAFGSVRDFVSTAQLLEITGTRAYDGAANTINNAAYLQVAATIATVEARHSAWLNTLNNISPFNSSFEMALTPAQVIAAASSFFESCPDNITLPTFAFEYVPINPNDTYSLIGQQPETPAQIENDNDVLNYALTLELFGGAFYNASSRFSQSDFDDAGYGDVFPYFQMIILHERAHVDFLTQTLESRNALRAQPCTYNIANYVDTVEHVLMFSRMLENLEVTAYDGAINTLTDYQLIQGAATIATVEARHGEYLNNVLLNRPVNNESLDATNAPAAILNITAPFFGPDCMTPTVPAVAYTLQAYGTQPAPGSSSTPTPTPTPTATPTATPTTCPSTPTPTPTCGTPTPSPSCGGSDDDDNGVTINFYFADMLRGL